MEEIKKKQAISLPEVKEILQKEDPEKLDQIQRWTYDYVTKFTKTDASSAKKAKQILKKHNFSKEDIMIISDAIRTHSFSQNTVPTTIEGKILQDADRLDALGAIGIARVFATGGSLKRPFYNSDDPFCKIRQPDDTIWTLDHFYKKLLNLESLMNTKSGKLEAKKRTKVLNEFLNQLKHEL